MVEPSSSVKQAIKLQSNFVNGERSVGVLKTAVITNEWLMMAVNIRMVLMTEFTNGMTMTLVGVE